MIGIDITRISRFNNKVDKKNFIKRVLHPYEIEEFNQVLNKAQFLATRWAIKEALYKCNNKLLHFDKILLKFKDYQYQFQNYQISTSTEDDYYIAFVIKEQHES